MPKPIEIEIMRVSELTDFEGIAGRTGGNFAADNCSLVIAYKRGYYIQLTTSPLWVRNGISEVQQSLAVENLFRSYRRNITDCAAMLTRDSLMVVSPSSEWEDRVLAYYFRAGTFSEKMIRIRRNLGGEVLRGLRDLARKSSNAGSQPIPNPLQVSHFML